MTDLSLRSSGTLEGLAQALSYCAEQATNTANVSTGSARDVVARYWSWSSAATGQLANHVRREAAQSLIRTTGYWSIRRLDPTDNNAYLYVAEELRDRALVFEEMRQEVSRLAGRWAMPGRTFVPDTNILLHHSVQFDLVDWPQALAVKESAVHLVLPMVVIHELDKAKHNTKKLEDGTTVGTRARKSLQRLDALIPASDPHLRAQVQTTLHATAATTIQVLIDHLDHVALPNADAEIVDRATYLQRIIGSPVTIITGDSTMRLLAAANGLRIAQLGTDGPPAQGGGGSTAPRTASH